MRSPSRLSLSLASMCVLNQRLSLRHPQLPPCGFLDMKTSSTPYPPQPHPRATMTKPSTPPQECKLDGVWNAQCLRQRRRAIRTRLNIFLHVILNLRQLWTIQLCKCGPRSLVEGWKVGAAWRWCDDDADVCMRCVWCFGGPPSRHPSWWWSILHSPLDVSASQATS